MTCHIAGCERPIHNGRGWCRMHYFRWYRTGSTGEPTPRKRMKRGTCMVHDCTKPDEGPSRLCKMHATRVKRHGDPHIVKKAEPLRGPDHPNWVGRQVSYGSAHARIRWAKGSASAHSCVTCSRTAEHWAYDNADPDELITERGYRYSPDPDHYQPMCARCHKAFDMVSATRRVTPPEGHQPPPPSLAPNYTPQGVSDARRA